MGSIKVEMRRFAGILSVLLVTMAFTATAMADTIQVLIASTGSPKMGRAAKLRLTQITRDTGSAQPDGVTKADWWLPAASKLNFDAATFCSIKKLQAGGCAANSSIGTGTAAYFMGSADSEATEATATVYNARTFKSGMVGRMLVVINEEASGAQAIWQGEISKAGKKAYGYRISFETMPAPDISPDVDEVLTELKLQIKAVRKIKKGGSRVTASYFKTPSSCNRYWFFKGDFTTASGLDLFSISRATCDSA